MKYKTRTLELNRITSSSMDISINHPPEKHSSSLFIQFVLSFLILSNQSQEHNSSTMSTIKDLKPDLITTEQSQDIKTTKHWRDLLPSIKLSTQNESQKPQSVPNINWDTVTKYFNPNAESIIVKYLGSSLDPHITYRVCKECGRPIAVDAILDHIRKFCPKLANGKSTSEGNGDVAVTSKTENDDDGDVNQKKGSNSNDSDKDSGTSGGSNEDGVRNERDDGDEEEEEKAKEGGNYDDKNNNNNKRSRKRAREEESDDDDDDGDNAGSNGEGAEDDADNAGSPGEVVVHTTGRVSGDKRPPPPYGTHGIADKLPPPENVASPSNKTTIKSEPAQKKQKTGISGSSAASTPGSSATPGAATKKKDRIIKQRNPTEKHLVDFDKQCGVSLPEGGYCARSLTCKSHSMGAKRAVPGRTRPFDELLAEYHREHQTKIGAAAEKRAKQQELLRQQKQQLKEQKLQKKLLLQKQRQMQRQNKLKEKSSGAQGGSNATAKGKGSTGGGGGDKGTTGAGSGTQGAMGRSGGSTGTHGSNAQGNRISSGAAGTASLTPEEETTQVLNGVSRSFPLPLDSTVLGSTRFRTKYMRMREMFASAFPVRQGYSSPGIGAIHSRVGYIDIDRASEYKFRIRVPQPLNPMNMGKNINPQQLRAMRQQQQQQMMMMTMMQGQMANRQYASNTQMQNQLQQQQVQSQLQMQVQHSESGAGPSNSMAAGAMIRRSETPSKIETKGLTPQEIQQQQLKLRQQQIQQQRYEAAAFQFASTNKMMSTPGGGTGSGLSLDITANNIHQPVGVGIPNGNSTMANTGGNPGINTSSRSNSNNAEVSLNGNFKQAMDNLIGIGGQVNISGNDTN